MQAVDERRSVPTKEPQQAEAACWVIAITRPGVLPFLRHALSVMPSLAVTVTQAASWQVGHDLAYRGVHIRADELVARIEIACRCRDVDWVVRAVDRAFEAAGPRSSADRVVVLPTRPSAG